MRERRERRETAAGGDAGAAIYVGGQPANDDPSPSPRRIARIAAALPVLAWLVYALTRPLARQQTLLEDDAYYYIVIARNLVASGVSTFDGVTRTNGYHPLWFLIDVGLVKLAGGTGAAFFAGLFVVSAVCALASGEITRRVLLLGWPRSPWVSGVVALFAGLNVHLFAGGMESTVAVPLHALFALCVLRARSARWDTARALGLGLVSSALVLARLDAIACVAMGLGWLAWGRPLREVVRAGVFLCAGLTPLAAYLAWNLFAYGALLTTSAAAKQLAVAPGVDWHIFAYLGWWQLVVYIGLPLVSVLAALRHVRSRSALLLVYAFPLLYYVVLAVRSPWPIWAWYAYPLALCASIASVHLLESVRPPRLSPAVAAAALGVAIVLARLPGRVGVTKSVLRHAEDLRSFVKSHPGRYAMGDRAGLTALVTGASILQLEGLVADRALLDDVRAESDLRAVLAKRRIDYLVDTRSAAGSGAGSGCTTVTEPHESQAPRAARMSARLCDAPVWQHVEPSEVATVVYALHAGSERSATR
jgi:hypothetical protein